MPVDGEYLGERLGSWLDRQTWWRMLRLLIEDDDVLYREGRLVIYETAICASEIARESVMQTTKLQQYKTC